MNFKINQQTIEIIRTTRKGSIGLKVEPNRIALMVPKRMSNDTIASFLNNEQEWLQTQINDKKENMPKCLSLSSGNELLLFGEKILYKEDHHTDVAKMKTSFEESTLTVFCKQKRKLKHPETAIMKEVRKFYSQQLEQVLAEKLADLAKIIKVKPTEISIKNYKSRWGSCYPDGRIQFNWRLAMAPISVIEYVIIHELCHLIHPNHSKAYWAEVVKYCPNYSIEKSWLTENGTTLMSL
ncbi:MAG TPA: hypothetical protein DD716_01870 [Thiomicrospira sp.]|nr:hypothetical protein [Thiomicrospira sp.]